MRKRVALLLVLALTTSGVLISAQELPSLGLAVTPEAQVPVGNRANNYAFGLGARLEGLLGLPIAEPVTPSLDFGYAFIPLNLNESGFAASTNLTLLRAALAAEATLPLGERFSIYARGYGGGFYGLLSGKETGGANGIVLGLGGGASFLVSDQLLFELGGSYDTYLDLYDGVALWLGTTVRLAGPGNHAIPRANFTPQRPGSLPAEGFIRFSQVELDRAFPVLYKYYDDHPIGRATIVNTGRHAVEEVEVRLSLRQFMDAPKVSARIDRLEPGEEAEVDIYALFTEEILSVTEGAKVAAELAAEYVVRDRGGIERAGADSEVLTLDTYDRNALRWDDDRKIAAFVTARDEQVQRFARNIASVIDDQGIEAIGRDLQLGILFLGALYEHRCSYVVDPSSPYNELSQNTLAVDAVQFPRQTLQFRAGDCDDLSATYAALLEAAGIPTAFVTVPGHIYTAFQLDQSQEEAGRVFASTGDVILRDDGTVWLPVETTLLREGFLAAWSGGARQWREHEGDGSAQLWPVREAWQVYEPVAFGVSDYEVDIPPRDAVSERFSTDLRRFVARQISGREAELLARIRERPRDQCSRNRLGVLYGRYGMYEEAEEQFRAALLGSANTPALVNLGNLAYLKNDLSRAADYYRRAVAEDPDSRAGLLGLARVEYATEAYAAARETHHRLAQLSPELASRFSYLGDGATDGGTGRAAAVTSRGTAVVWEEEI
ncbi:MAG: hypothetical protein ACLFQZ_00655 [Spirochaetaceae bacterium]